MAKPALNTVPKWACPRLLWSIALGIGHPEGSSAFVKLFQMFCGLMGRLLTVPIQRSVGQAAMLPKNNCKPGCLSVRL
eukprot:2880331-Heterocapsa_arctica.AAC.1